MRHDVTIDAVQHRVCFDAVAARLCCHVKVAFGNQLDFLCKIFITLCLKGKDQSKTALYRKQQ